MHEMAIAQQIVGIVEETISSQAGRRCKTVHLRIGELTAIVPDSLIFAYEAITDGTPLASSRLDIQSIPVRARCRSCQGEFGIQDFEFSCSKCGSASIEILEGRELTVEKLEME